MKSPPPKSQTQKSWGVAETWYFRILERSSSLKSQALRTFSRLALTAHVLCGNKPLANIILLRFRMSSHRNTHVHRCMQIRGAQYGATCLTFPRLTNKNTEARVHVRSRYVSVFVRHFNPVYKCGKQTSINTDAHTGVCCVCIPLPQQL